MNDIGLGNIRPHILTFYKNKLTEFQRGDNASAVLELIVVSLNSDEQKEIKLCPPGTMHRPRCRVARAICIIL